MAVTCLRAPVLSTKRLQQPPPHTPAGALPIFAAGCPTVILSYMGVTLVLHTYIYIYVVVHRGAALASSPKVDFVRAARYTIGLVKTESKPDLSLSAAYRNPG